MAQENLSASDLAEMIGEYCVTCNRLDPADFMRCQHCGNRICGDCLTEAEDQSGVCSACFKIEFARLQRMAGLDDRHTSGGKSGSLSSPTDDEIVLAARRLAS